MPNPSEPTTPPDPATNYERAKPEKQSPSRSLDLPTTAPPHQQDELARNAEPRSPKKGVAERP